MRNIEEGVGLQRQQQNDRFNVMISLFINEAHQSFHRLLNSYSQLQCDFQDYLLQDHQSVETVEEFFGSFAIFLQHFQHMQDSSSIAGSSINGIDQIEYDKEKNNHSSPVRNRQFFLPSVIEKDDANVTETLNESAVNSISDSTTKHSSTDSDSSHKSTEGKSEEANRNREMSIEAVAKEAAIQASRSPLTVHKHLDKVRAKLQDEQMRSHAQVKRKITEHDQPLYFQVMKETIKEYEQQLNLEDDQGYADKETTTTTNKPAEKKKTEFLNILQQKLKEKAPENVESFDNVRLSGKKRMSITEPVYAEVIRKTLEQFGRRKLEQRKSLSEHKPCFSPNLLTMFEENMVKNNMIEENEICDDSSDDEEDDNDTSLKNKNEDPVYMLVLRQALKQRRRSLHPKIPEKIQEEESVHTVNDAMSPVAIPMKRIAASGNNHSRSSSDISLASEEVSEINRKTFISASPHRHHQNGEFLEAGESKPALPKIPSPDYSVPDQSKDHPHHINRPFWCNEDGSDGKIQTPASAFASTIENSHGNTNTAKRSNSKRRVSNSSLMNDVIKEEDPNRPDSTNNIEINNQKIIPAGGSPKVVTLVSTTANHILPDSDKVVSNSPAPPPQIFRSKKPSKKKVQNNESIGETPSPISTTPSISTPPPTSVSPIQPVKNSPNTTMHSPSDHHKVTSSSSIRDSASYQRKVAKEKVTMVPSPDYSPVSSPEGSPNLQNNRKFFHSPSPLPVEKRLIEVVDDDSKEGNEQEILAKLAIQDNVQEVSSPPLPDRLNKPKKKMKPSEMSPVTF